jgi:O-antigen ligase
VLYAFEVVIAPSKSVGAGDFVRLASGVLVGVAAFYVFDTRGRLLQLSRAVFLGGVAVAVMTITQYAISRVSPGAAHAIYGRHAFINSYDQSHSTHVARVAGALGGPGETSAFLLVTASFGLLRYALLRDTARCRGLAAGIALMGVAIVATLTRASTAGFVLLILIWMIQRQLRFVSSVGMRTKIVALSLGLVVLAVPLLGSNTLHTRLWDVNPNSSGTGFAQGRGAIWRKEIKLIEASNVPQLLVGHGARSSEIQIGTCGSGGIACSPENYGQPIKQSPHNLLVWLVMETGVIGTALYIAFLIGAGRRYRAAARWRRYEDAGKVGAVALAGLIAYQAQGMFLLSPTSPSHGIYFMLFIGATLRACTAAPTAWRAASAQID